MTPFWKIFSVTIYVFFLTVLNLPYFLCHPSLTLSIPLFYFKPSYNGVLSYLLWYPPHGLLLISWCLWVLQPYISEEWKLTSTNMEKPLSFGYGLLLLNHYFQFHLFMLKCHNIVFLGGWLTAHCVSISHFSLSVWLVGGHLSSFHSLSIVKRATRSTSEQVSLG